MKATVKEGIKGFSGKLDGALYYYHPRLKRTLMRRIPEMPIQPQNHTYATIARQLKALEPSNLYRYDFKLYLSQLRDSDEEVRVPSWYGLFVKMMWALQAKYPDQADLRTLTKARIHSQNLPCISVKAAVEDGLLRPVPGWQNLDHQI